MYVAKSRSRTIVARVGSIMLKLELELIQSHMAQKPVLRAYHAKFFMYNSYLNLPSSTSNQNFQRNVKHLNPISQQPFQGILAKPPPPVFDRPPGGSPI